ncbi:ABC transporter substrate binding protein [Streptococcus pluranimalium]|uniref:ABC transporter substrate binding protein n=1 Tax=Streptococcus pluranimalium TaxID=82348 RepID=UPI003F66267F
MQYMKHESLTETREGIIAELEKQGYEDGKDIIFDYQNAQGDRASLQSISENLVKDNDLVIGITTQSSQAANIDKPIIFSDVTDPISAKLVKSMKNPDGLVTGISNRQPLELLFTALQTVLPKAKTVGMMYTTSEINAEVQVENAKALLDFLRNYFL